MKIETNENMIKVNGEVIVKRVSIVGETMYIVYLNSTSIVFEKLVDAINYLKAAWLEGYNEIINYL